MHPSDSPSGSPDLADTDPATRTSKALWFGFLGIWVLTMVDYGAVAPWAVAATALALAFLNALAIHLLPGGLRLSGWTVAWLGIVGGVILLQLLPLGPVMFPLTHAMRQRHGVSTLMPGTADLFLTLRSLAQLEAYVLAGLLVVRLRNAGLSMSSLMKGLAGLLVLQAVYGILQFYANFREIPFYGPRDQGDSASGTMVNRNTYGGLMAMGAVLASALAYSRFAWNKWRAGATSAARLESGMGWTIASGLFVFGLILSHSRGAATGAVVGLVLIPFLYKGRGSAAAAVGLLGAGVLAVALADPTVLVHRFEELDPYTIGENPRVRIWTTTLRAAALQPIAGWGLGSHPMAYHPYQPPELIRDIRHAHNEYINFFFEGGVALAVAMLGGLVAWGLRSWRATQRLPGPDRFLPTAVLCAGAAEVVHSVVDFDCRVTTAGLLFAALVGLAASVTRPRAEPGRRLWAAITISSAVTALLVLLPSLDTARLVDRALSSPPDEAQTISRRVLALSPFQYQAAWVVARGAERKEDQAMAAGRYALAADLWPAHPGLQREVGRWYWDEWRTTGDRAYYDRAATCFRRLFTQLPGQVEETLEVLWEQGRPPAQYEGLIPPRNAAAWGAMAAFLASKGQWTAAQSLFDHSVPSVRENVVIFDRFGDALRSTGQWGMEALVRERRLALYADARSIADAARAWANLEAWDKALERVTQACRIDPVNVEWVTLKADIYMARGDTDRALESFILAVQMSPHDPGLLERRARIYMAAKMYGEAAGDYQRILRSTPADREATLGLARALASGNDRAGARRVLDDWLRKHPGDSEASGVRSQLR
jgi:tetratricopeptide (TPR) repeat protein/O-antigen ligase